MRRSHSPMQNIINFLLLVGVPVPAILCAGTLFRCLESQANEPIASSCDEYAWLGALIRVDSIHPVLTLNVFFFVFVNVSFYLIALLQASTWLIDPYWTLIPPLLALFYRFHPSRAVPQMDTYDHARVRADIAFMLVCLWSLRLTHSYFRREAWQFGEREDWRFAQYRRQLGPVLWIPASFFMVYVSQQVMLIGLTLPFYAMHFHAENGNLLLDIVATVVCLSGILFAWVADNQLDSFMSRNRFLKSVGKPQVLVLKEGLWRFSRHPNHFGEALWWIGLAIFAIASGGPWWSVFGFVFNHACDWGVTLHLIEDRMLSRRERREAYKQYQMHTSLLLPLFPAQTKSHEE